MDEAWLLHQVSSYKQRNRGNLIIRVAAGATASMRAFVREQKYFNVRKYLK